MQTKAIDKKSKEKAVLISGGRLSLGGVQTHLQILCKVLCQAGVEVTIAATGNDWSLEVIKETQNLGVRFLLPPKIFSQSKNLSNILSFVTLPFHLRQQHFTSLYCIGAGQSHQYLRQLLGSRTVGIYHEIVFPPSPTSLAGQCAAKLGTIVANSEKVGHEMAQWWPNIPVRVIPFLTAEAPLPIPQPRAAIGSREIRVVYLGRLVSHKRPDQLVREWNFLSTLSPLSPARLDIFGSDIDPTMLNELRQFVVENSFGDKVQIHGAYKINQLPDILSQADVVVLPSQWEGLPLVLVEAMQRGVPIVATAVGGTEELGKDNPDVIITGSEWDAFVDGLLAMSQKLRSGYIDAIRLHQWTERRYGYSAVSQKWLDALINPQDYFWIKK